MAEKKVVVYEPDEKFHKVLNLFFRGTGYRVVFTGNHRELTRIAENNPPDLFLVAVERSGVVSPELVPTLTGGGAVPIIVMSRYPNADELVAGGGAALGAAAYLKKPFQKQQLVQALAAVPSAAAAPRVAGRAPAVVEVLGLAEDTSVGDDRACRARSGGFASRLGMCPFPNLVSVCACLHGRTRKARRRWSP